MERIAAALPITPVTLAARIFADSREPLTDADLASRMERYREQWRDRVWLLRENSGEELWRAAKRLLELRHLIQPAERWRSDLFEGEGVPVVEDALRWNPNEILLRDYYANSLLSFDEVKARGWPDSSGRRSAVGAQQPTANR